MSRAYRHGLLHVPTGPLPQIPDLDLFTPEILQKLTRELRPDPVTGRTDYSKIQGFLDANVDDPNVQKIISRGMETVAQTDQTDISNYDFASLTPAKDTLWQFTIADRGRSSPVNKRFLFHCTGSRGEPRHLYSFDEIPEPPVVLKFVRDAIANRPSPMTPALPEIMLFSPEYERYVSVLAPFLDSLPRPFGWSVESAGFQAARDVIAGIHKKYRGEQYMDLIEQCQSAGKLAYSKKNRAGAIDAFSRAIDHAEFMLEKVDDRRHKAAARRMLAVCLANRAGAHLMEGSGMNAKEALSDAEKAEVADSTYVKAYHRQARAHEHLAEVGKAREVMRRAMQKPGLEAEQSLREQLHRLEVL